MATLLISIFGCFKKKEMKNDLPTWLENNFPGQLEVVENVVDLDLKNLYYKKKTTIITDKTDKDVQIAVTWFKEKDDLGITKEEVQEMMESSKRDIQAARNLLKALKDNGLNQFSVGVIEMAAYILPFEEPTPERRKDYLTKILSAIDALPDHNQTSIWIEWMESSVQGEYFKEIIPLGYWKRGGTYHENNKILSLDFEWSEGLEVDVLSTGWAINATSKRALGYKDDAYKAGLAWAEKNLSAPFYLEKDQMIAVGNNDEDQMAVEFDFPYFSAKPNTEEVGFEENALGHVRVVYHADQKKVTSITKVSNDE